VTSLRPRLIAALLTLPLAAVTLAGCTSAGGDADAAAKASAPHSSAPAAAGSAPSAPVTPSHAPTPTAPASAPLSAAQQRQVTYALTYWNNYNSGVYGNDNPNGGDCANFVSQTLIQRGWKMDAAWYNHGQNAMSGAWAYVPSMRNYFIANKARLGLEQLGDADRAKFAAGDVVIFWWQNADGSYSAGPDHVQVIDRLTTGADGKVKVEMASHNNDAQYRDLDNEITVEHPGAKYEVWHLTKDTNS